MHSRSSAVPRQSGRAVQRRIIRRAPAILSGLLWFFSMCLPAQAASPIVGVKSIALSGWSKAGLPFLPVAINNEEVIVGNNQTLGAVRYQNGAYAGLPRINYSTTGDPYSAVDIVTHGEILGIPGADTSRGYPAVVWQTQTSYAYPVGPAPVGFFVPRAMNNAQTVVGWAGDALVAWKWSQVQGYSELKAHASGYFAIPTDINDTGYVAGYDFSFFYPGKILLWSPGNSVSVLDSATGLRGYPRIRSNGEVVWANSTQIKRRLNGVTTIAAAPAGMDKLTVVSDAGRLAGTLIALGVRRGWTSYQGSLMYLDPIDPAPGDYVEPTGINACGSIVGVVHRTNNPDYGIYFKRSGILWWCDDQPIVAL